MEEVEKWKVVDQFPDYVVSNFGKVWSHKSNRFIFSSSYLLDAYSLVSLSNGTSVRCTGIHVVVAEAFIPNPENKPEVNHIDGVKCNNHASNLEWVTKSENQIHNWRVLHPHWLVPGSDVKYQRTGISDDARAQITAALNEWKKAPNFKEVRNKFAAIYKKGLKDRKNKKVA